MTTMSRLPSRAAGTIRTKKHSAEKLEYTPEPDSIDELTEQTRRLNEEAEKLEAEARRYDYEKGTP